MPVIRHRSIQVADINIFVREAGDPGGYPIFALSGTPGSSTFNERHVADAEDRGIRLVGTDFLSIEQHGVPGHPTHVTLLKAGVIILEGLDLSKVDPGAYELFVLPLKVLGGDGAPARAILRTS